MLPVKTESGCQGEEGGRGERGSIRPPGLGTLGIVQKESQRNEKAIIFKGADVCLDQA